MKTVPCRRTPHRAETTSGDDTVGTQKQLKDEMSVDLANAQMAEAWHIMSENEKGPSYSLGVNKFTDLTKEEFVSAYLGYTLQNVSKLVTTLGRFHYDGGILDLPSDWDWSESSVEVITPVMNQGQCGSCWAFSMTGALEGVLAMGNGWTQTMSEQQILDSNSWGSGCASGTQTQLSLQCSCGMASVEDGGALLSRMS